MEQHLYVATASRFTGMHLFYSPDGGVSGQNITGDNLPKDRNPLPSQSILPVKTQRLTGCHPGRATDPLR